MSLDSHTRDHDHRSLISTVALLALLSGAVPVAGQTTAHWTNSGGGFFLEPTNWLNGYMPGKLDDAEFGLHASGTYTVVFETEETVANIDVNDGDVTFFGTFGAGLFVTDMLRNSSLLTLEGIDVTVDLLDCAGDESTLTIMGHGTTTADSVVIDTPGGQPALEVRSPAHLEIGSLLIGRDGRGSLSVFAGGSVRSTQPAWIGQYGDGEGQVYITGADAIWTAEDTVYVGKSPDGEGGRGDLYVSDGGVLDVERLNIWAGIIPTGQLWLQDGGIVHADIIEIDNDYGTCLIQEANTELRVNKIIGLDGGYDALQVFGGDLYLGHSGGDTTSANTMFTGITWQVDGYMAVGYDKASTLTVTNGTVESDRLWIGREVGSDGSLARLDGPDASWTSRDVIVVGSKANGRLEIVDGAAVESLSGHVGYHATSDSAVLVNGGGSSWTCPVFLTLGREGTANVEVSSGGLVHCGMGRLGFAETGVVDMAIQSGGAMFLCDDWLDVGVEGTATLTLSGNGMLSAPEINIAHEATADGELVLLDESTMTISDSIYIGGDADAAGGSGLLSIAIDATVTIDDSLRIWNAGRLELLGGTLEVAMIIDEDHGATELLGGTLHVDQYHGDLVVQGSTIAPGQSVGTTTVHGQYHQTAGELEIEMESEASHDRLEVLAGGDITLLGGELTVKLLAGYVPNTQASFTIATCEGARTGRFDNAGAFVPVEGGGYFAVDYGPSAIVLSNYSLQLPGDIDGDGDVDQADLGALLAAYGSGPGDPNWDPDADLDGDGDIDQADLGLLLSNYGG